MLSVVIPLFNEEESLALLYKELVRGLGKIAKGYEIIFVDDGSTDSSLEILKGIAKKNNKVRIFSFRKNQGKAEALTFGFQKAFGDYIATLDADLQDIPSEIPKLIDNATKGAWDLVCGWRKDRKDPLPKIISSKLFNYLTGIIWGFSLHDYNCGLKVYTRDAAKSLYLYGGMHRFIPLLLHQQGFSVLEIPVIHKKREFGKSKYGFSKIWKDLPDVFTMFFLSKYARRPLHFFGTVGGFISLLGVMILSYLAIIHAQGEAIATRPLFFFGMILVFSGIQIFFTGFLADLIINASQRPQGAEREKAILKFENS
ncbi:MAG: glycosyl transferase [Candidatus Levybacteria bacterium RIFCSPHIGHO2_02_FULL_37_13]|nr:MAG: glycosyl transferase [Candidatus Levybacteria bacterium RIFCSPHIGHO2_02_FULL_37_13]